MPSAKERVVTGLDDIDKLLKKFERVHANAIAVAAIRGGAKRAAKSMKASIPSAEKRIRKAIGYRVVRGNSKRFTSAKAGASVGSSKAKFRSIEQDRDDKPGVGISAANIHWWILGTIPRVQKTTGKQTGAMPRQHAGLGQVAAQSSGTIFRDMRKAAQLEMARRLGKR